MAVEYQSIHRIQHVVRMTASVVKLSGSFWRQLNIPSVTLLLSTTSSLHWYSSQHWRIQFLLPLGQYGGTACETALSWNPVRWREQRGAIEYQGNGSVVVALWKDNKPVFIASDHVGVSPTVSKRRCFSVDKKRIQDGFNTNYPFLLRYCVTM